MIFMHRLAIATISLLPLDASSEPPRPGAVKLFKDWAVGCDNGLTCTMASLVPGVPENSWPPVTVNLIRAPGAAGRFRMDVEGSDKSSPSIVVDGRDYGTDAEVIAAAMARGKAAGVKGTGRTISLAGASAALRYIDAMQGRSGTVTAVVAKGSGSASSVPTAPAVPMLSARTLVPIRSKLDTSMLAAMRKIGGCEQPSDDLSLPPSVAKAGEGQRVVLLPCHSAPYNVGIAVFVLEGGKIRPAPFDAPVGFEDPGDATANKVHEIVGGGIRDNRVMSFTKGRGLGDCGVQQVFAWDGQNMRLTRQFEMPDCRGNGDFIQTWRVEVRS